MPGGGGGPYGTALGGGRPGPPGVGGSLTREEFGGGLPGAPGFDIWDGC